jgi:hypothetical protein
LAKDDKPRLCGGTFFVLVLQALKPRKSARAHFEGDRDGMSDPEVLIGLINVINPDYESPKLDRIKTKANDFKACKLSKGEYLPFGDTQEIEMFDERVKTDYQSALDSMTEFVKSFIDKGEKIQKSVHLVKALIDLIQQDDSIRPDEFFYVLENGEQIKKAALGSLKKVCLPAFLLGIWHYVVVNRKDNRVGTSTYNKWCPKNGGGPRKYCGDMGKRIKVKIEIYMPDIKYEETTNTKGDDGWAGTDDSNCQQKKSESNQQIIQNALFIQQNGNNNNVIPNYGTMKFTIGENNEVADE